MTFLKFWWTRFFPQKTNAFSSIPDSIPCESWGPRGPTCTRRRAWKAPARLPCRWREASSSPRSARGGESWQKRWWRCNSSTASQRKKFLSSMPTKFISGTAGASAFTALRKPARSEEHTSELQSRLHLVCRLLLEKKKNTDRNYDRASYLQVS